MSLGAAAVFILALAAWFGALTTLITWPDAHARHYLQQRPAHAIRRGVIITAVSAIWSGLVLAVLVVLS